MDRADRLKRIRYRAWHRGTKEADLLVGGFFDSHHAGWGDDETAWFERLLEEQDADIMAWSLGTARAPERFEGPMLRTLQTHDYIKHPE